MGPGQNHIKKFDFCCSAATSFHLLICDVYQRELQPGRVRRGEERRVRRGEERQIKTAEKKIQENRKERKALK